MKRAFWLACAGLMAAALSSAQEPRVLGTLTGHTKEVRAIAFAPDGRTLVSASDDGTIRLWDVATCKNTATRTWPDKEANYVVFDPAATTLAAGCTDGTIKLWDVASGKVAKVLKGHTTRVEPLAYSLDGKVLASSEDGVVKLWDVATGQNTATLEAKAFVMSLAFSPDKKTLVSGGYCASPMNFWDLTTGRCINPEMEAYVKMSVAFSDDSKIVMSFGDCEFALRDARTGERVASGYVCGWDPAPDRKTMPICDNRDGVGKLWDGRNAVILKGLRDDANTLTYSRDSKLLAAGSKGGAMTLWDVQREGDTPLRRFVIGAGPALPLEQRLSIMRGVLQEGDCHLRGGAAMMLIQHRDPAALPLISRIADAIDDIHVADDVIKGLAGWEDDATVPPLLAFLENQSSFSDQYDYVAAARAHEALHKRTGFWFPFNVAASQQAWEEVRQLPARERRQRLAALLPFNPFPLKARLEGTRKDARIVVTNGASHSVSLTSCPTKILVRRAGRDGWEYEGARRDSKTTSSSASVTLAAGESIRIVVRFGRAGANAAAPASPAVDPFGAAAPAAMPPPSPSRAPATPAAAPDARPDAHAAPPAVPAGNERPGSVVRDPFEADPAPPDRPIRELKIEYCSLSNRPNAWIGSVPVTIGPEWKEKE